MRLPLLLAISSPMIFSSCGGDSRPSDAGEKAGSSAAPDPSSPDPVPQAPEGSRGTAAIEGLVKFAGQPPPLQPIRMDSDTVCASLHSGPVYPEDVLLDEKGGLRNVFVYLSWGLEGTKFPVPAEPVNLDQKGCQSRPRVFGIQARQRLRITNSDGTYHNVHAFSTKGQDFNQGMPAERLEIWKSFSRPEVMVKIKCEVHPWMGAFCGVLEHPYFSVTEGGGKFKIGGISAGRYRVSAWHERFGELEKEIEISAGETKSIEFEYQD